MSDLTNTPAEILIEEWDASRSDSLALEIEMLAEVLHAVVHGGASVSFCTPFSIDEARAFWVEKVLPEVRTGKRRVVVARLNGKQIVGTVQLELDMPPNQQHRAAVAKLLVHPNARRRGIARALMLALEELALTEARTLLTLDTVTGSNAESLYRSLDFVTVGVIRRYARGALTPELEGTTIMYKEIGEEGKRGRGEEGKVIGEKRLGENRAAAFSYSPFPLFPRFARFCVFALYHLYLLTTHP